MEAWVRRMVPLICMALVGCGAEPAPEIPAEEPVAKVAEPGLVEVTADEYAFTGPSTFPSGWVRIRFVNQGHEPHFLLIWDLPEGKTFDDWAREVTTPFQDFYAEYRAGEVDQATFFDKLIGAIPEWFYETVPKGGPGFTAAGHTSETIVYLEPGDNYVLECYIRSATQGDRFHGSEGMLRPLIVTAEASGLEPPEADIDIALSSFEVTVEGDLTAGSHLARVRVTDIPEGFIKHNVHLARLEGDVTGADVAGWMDWVEAMQPPAPAIFLGGAGQTIAGRESYVPVHLEPGRYAWVSESYGAQGMVSEFTVQ